MLEELMDIKTGKKVLHSDMFLACPDYCDGGAGDNCDGCDRYDNTEYAKLMNGDINESI